MRTLLDRCRVRLPEGGWLLYLVGLLALLPVAVMALVSIQIANRALEDVAQERVQASGLAAATAVEQELQRLADFSRVVSERPELHRAIDSGETAQVQWHLEQLVQEAPHFSIAGVVDPAGDLLAVVPTTPSAVGQNYAHRDWYRGAMSRRGPYVSEAFRSDASGSPYIVAAAIGIPNWNGLPGTSGVVVIGVDVATLETYIDDYSRTQDLNIFLTDQSGTVVSANSGPPQRLAFADSGSIEAALAGNSTLEVIDTPDGKQHSYTAPVSRLGWTVTTVLPAEDSNALWIQSVIVGLASVLATMILAGLVILERVLRRRSETVTKLARSEALLDSVFDNIPVMVSVKDSHTLRYHRVNKMTEVTMGRERAEVLGRTTREIFPQEGPDRNTEAEREALRTGELVNIQERTIDGPSGQIIINSTKVPLCDPDGSFRYVLSISEDVTESLRDKEEIEKAIVEARRANSAKSDFLSRMSHELRTPLNAILGFGQLLEMDDLSEDQVEYVGQIIRGGQHLLSLVNEILDLARIETGRLSLSLEPVNLGEIIQEAFGLMRPLADQTRISLVDLTTETTAQYVKADQQRVKQVVINLVSNAIKYNKPDGRVEVRCSRGSQGFIRVSVSDTGPGIAGEDLDRIFNPFERLSAEHSQIEGSGLGLAFCKHVVEAMGGSIGVETSPDSGSTFWVELAIVADPDTAAEIASATNGGDGSPAGENPDTDVSVPAIDVVCIDDISSNRELIQRVMESNPDATLRLASDGEEGLLLIAERRPDVVLLDMNLPGVAGKDVLRMLRNDPGTRAIPIVVVSADASASRIEGLGRVRADAYISKPIDIRALVGTLRRLAPVPVG